MRADSQPAAVWHGITSIEKEVQEHLLQLEFHTLYRDRGSGQLTSHLNAARGQLMLEKSEHVVDHGVEVDWTRDVRPPRARKIQQAVDDLGGPKCLPLNLLEHLGLWILWVRSLEQHLGKTRNAGQGRVHLMSDTRRQQADGRHLLRDLELFLELDPRGDVLHDDHHPAGVTIGSE